MKRLLPDLVLYARAAESLLRLGGEGKAWSLELERPGFESQLCHLYLSIQPCAQSMWLYKPQFSHLQSGANNPNLWAANFRDYVWQVPGIEWVLYK